MSPRFQCPTGKLSSWGSTDCMVHPGTKSRGHVSSVLVEPALRNDIGFLFDSSFQDTQVSNVLLPSHSYTLLLCPLVSTWIAL